LLWVYYSAGLFLFGGIISHKLQQLASSSPRMPADDAQQGC